MSKIAMRFGEVVLKTTKYDALKAWYCRLLVHWIRQMVQGNGRVLRE